MKVKEWSYLLIRGKNTPELIRSDVFYTSDTEAFLILKLKDARIYPKQALLNLHNLNDDSLVSETVDVNDGVIEWEMREEIIEHGGSWRAQVVYENIEDGQPEKYTSPIIGFDVKIDLLNQRTARMFAVESWERLLANAEGFVGDLDELESNYQELLNTGVLQTKINEKLEDLEDEYAPRLTNVEQNKADTSEVNQLANLKADKTYVNQLNDSTTAQLAQTAQEIIKLKASGPTSNLPTTDLYVGQTYFDTDKQMPFIYDGKRWIRYDGSLAYLLKIQDGNLFASSAIYEDTSYSSSEFIGQNGIDLSKDLVMYFNFKMADNDDFINVQYRQGAANKIHLSFGYDWVDGTKDGSTISIYDETSAVKKVIATNDFYTDFSEVVIWYDSKWGYFNIYVDNVLIDSWKSQAGGTDLSLINNIRTSVGSTTTNVTFKHHYIGHPLVGAIGDSITGGATKHAPNPDHYAGVDDFDNNYPKKIGDYLKSIGIRNYFVANKGVNGNDTNQMLSRFDNDIINNNVKYVLIQGGINDYLSEDVAMTASNKANMAQTAQSNNITPIVLGITPVKSSQITRPFSIELHEHENGVVYDSFEYIQIWQSIEDVNNPNSADPAYMADNTHPNNLGYAKMADEVSRYIE